MTTRILVDMDGVIADWGAHYGYHLDRHGHAAYGMPRHQDQLSYNLSENLTKTERMILTDIMEYPGFYEDLAPIEGGIEALHLMASKGFEVFIVTKPWVRNPTCASDKLNWVREHLGESWGGQVILTSDKTLIRGDYLIDDKPTITGAESLPGWTHVLFDQPYNQGIDKPRINNWSEWETIIDQLESKGT